jgi:hypothetical protein
MPIPKYDDICLVVVRPEIKRDKYGDRHFTASVDIRIAITPLPAGNTTAQPYTFVPAWPVDPNAPVIDDEDDWEEEF